MTANDKGRPPADQGPRPRRKAAPQNPIDAAVVTWLASLPPLDTAANAPAFSTPPYENNATLLAQAPKRWTVYEPMVLLPTGSLSSPEWTSLLARLIQQDPGLVQDLWQRILAGISRKTGAKQPLTHLAVNEGIPLVRDQVQPKQQEQPLDNVLRSPTGLSMLHGDFGPPLDFGADCDSSGQTIPTDEDFDKAFWVSTKQNGICQTWAPRWTMFSRGNIKEKARLLDFHKAKIDSHPSKSLGSGCNSTNPADKNKRHLESTHDNTIAAAVTTAKLSTCYAVDMYAGIGYFVFSYARLGLRVLCWEINPWSVEGLRRGAKANGWTLRVVRDAEQLARPTPELVSRTRHQDGRGRHRAHGRHGSIEEEEAGAAQIVVFLEDNSHAARRIAELREAWQDEETRQTANRIVVNVSGDKDEEAPPALTAVVEEKQQLEVLHVNGGLLPASTGSWPGAWDVTSTSLDAWLHLHENVGVADIERRKAEIEQWFREYQEQDHQQRARSSSRDMLQRRRRTARVEHVELVKTFAPGVWHCVFDVYVTNRAIDEP